jgi:hypothetical protein
MKYYQKWAEFGIVLGKTSKNVKKFKNYFNSVFSNFLKIISREIQENNYFEFLYHPFCGHVSALCTCMVGLYLRKGLLEFRYSNESLLSLYKSILRLYDFDSLTWS